MKITDISLQARDNNCVNVSVDGVYSFSLDIAQVTDLNLKVGRELSDGELEELQEESKIWQAVYASTCILLAATTFS